MLTADELRRHGVAPGASFAPVAGAQGCRVTKLHGCRTGLKDAQVESDGTVTLSVPSPADKGFFILKSKGAE